MPVDPPETAEWLAPVANGPLAATVPMPGSKSLTNRALVLASLSTSPTRITAPLHARDTSLMVDALTALGARVETIGDDWVITPGDFRSADVQCGLAGTVMRFVPPLAALAVGASRFDGDPHARERPMSTLLQALTQAGAQISADSNGYLPFTVQGSGALPGGVVECNFSSSSQFVSAMLLIGARTDKGLEIHHVGGEVPSLPHIQMTCQALQAAGVDVRASGDHRWLVRPGAIDSPDIVIEPDLSNAAPFLAAALVAGGSVTVPHWPSRTTQAGDSLRVLLAQMGASVHWSDAGLTVSGGSRIGPLVADLHEVGELTPVLAALCAMADGQSRLTGVAHIRGHETDRLAAIRTEINNLGGDATETDDGLVIRPAKLAAGRWRAYADHRMAQAGALLGLRVPGVTVDDIGSTRKTMADFPGLWAAMLPAAG